MHRTMSTPPALNASLASTTSQVIDLKDLSGISVQVNYADDAPAAKTFDSATKAALTIDSVVFTAVTAGADGNDITIEYEAGGTAGAEDVTVVGTTILVSIDDTPVTGSTGNNVKDAVNGDVAAALLVLVTGASASVQAVTAEAPLEGGLDSELAIVANTMTIPAHPYVTGTKVALTTAGVLPTGLSATNYWVIKVDADTIQLAADLADAVAGDEVNFTTEGSGVHTLTAATSTSNVYKLQSSNDSSNWTDVSGKTVTIATSSGTAQWDIDRPMYRYLKLLYTPSAGQVAVETIISQVIE